MMWNPFRTEPLLPEDDALFQVETYRWLLTHFGESDFYENAQLVLPTPAFFPSVVESEVAAAEATFAQVKRYAGLEQWDVVLQVQDADPNLHMAPTLVVQNVAQSPLGTFSVNEQNEVTITYNPKVTANPLQMVATFAHELAHYLTATASEPPPGGWENWEFATDIAATFLGFGVFQANAAFTFRQYASVDAVGWETSGSGYLSEAEHSYALALFLCLKGIDPTSAFAHCKPTVKAYLKRALSECMRAV